MCHVNSTVSQFPHKQPFHSLPHLWACHCRMLYSNNCVGCHIIIVASANQGKETTCHMQQTHFSQNRLYKLTIPLRLYNNSGLQFQRYNKYTQYNLKSYIFGLNFHLQNSLLSLLFALQIYGACLNRQGSSVLQDKRETSHHITFTIVMTEAKSVLSSSPQSLTKTSPPR